MVVDFSFQFKGYIMVANVQTVDRKVIYNVHRRHRVGRSRGTVAKWEEEKSKTQVAGRGEVCFGR